MKKRPRKECQECKALRIQVGDLSLQLTKANQQLFVWLQNHKAMTKYIRTCMPTKRWRNERE